MTIAEDVISDWFKLTLDDWKKYRYELKTRRHLSKDEIVPDVFAQILRYGPAERTDRLRKGDFYRICLQDQNILCALEREEQLKLRPLLVYVLTHELVHIIRFYKFFQFFHADAGERAEEESRVHVLTYDMLKATGVADLPMIFDLYSRHREMID